MTHFDETSGSVLCLTPWGHWYQTVEEVYVLIDVPKGTIAKQLRIGIKPDRLSVYLEDKKIICGILNKKVLADECVWTLEDNQTVRIQLLKTISDPTSKECCWPGLLVDQFIADPFTKNEMEKKLTLQRFAFSHPGFDFSNSDITGDFMSGGPNLPS